MSYATTSSRAKEGDLEQSMRLLCLAVVPRDETLLRQGSFPLYWLQYPHDIEEERMLQALRQVLIDPLQEEMWHAAPDDRAQWLERWSSAYKWWA
ncbi:MAG: hypothetical protein ACRD3W_14725, partial [Terriglobales bacterium]